MRTSLAFCILFALAVSAWAQDRTISGKVISAENGIPVPGVNVVLKGTSVGTVTDADGVYTLSVPSSKTILIFSFVGMVTVEAEAGERNVIDVQMGMDVTQLSEIVVTGTGVPTEKRKLAFSVESIQSDELPLAPTASIDQALIGKIPGALIMSGNGSPGSNISILLRGVNSINRGTAPMILMNGVQVASTNLNSLDLNTIDRVEVVQGAAAATIYGAQGANGVIQIFTKKGKKGKLEINFSSSVANNQYLNIGGLAAAKLHGFKTDSLNNVIGTSGAILAQDSNTLLYNENVVWTPQDTSILVNKPYNRNLVYNDHIKDFYIPALTLNNSVSVSGGGDNFDFNLSASNNRQESNFKGDGYNDRTNFISNLGISLSPKLKLRSISQLVYTKNTINIFNKQDFTVSGLIYYTLNARPFADLWLKDSQGNYGIKYGNATGANVFNPNYSFQYTDTRDIKTDIIQSLELLYTPFKFLNIDLRYGINHLKRTVRYQADNQSTNANSIANNGLFDGRNATSNTGEISTFEDTNTSQNFLATATLNLDFRQDLGLTFPIRTVTQIGYDYRRSKLYDYDTYGLGLPLQEPVTASMATSFRILTDRTTEFITYGYLVNQRFEWGEWAGVSGGFRSDYSSAYGSGSRPFTFPRADAFIRVSGLDFWDESFLAKLILEWKVRGAFGKAGIQPNAFDRFQTLTTRTLGTSSAYYLGPNQSNLELDVEVSTEFEAGTDFILTNFDESWLRNTKLNFTWWTRRTNNAIFPIDQPPSSGVGTKINNSFGISSQGIQASLNTTILKTKNFNWAFTTNFGKQTSKITSVDGEIIAGAYVLTPGKKVGQLNGYLLLHDVDAIDPNTGLPFIPESEQDKYEVASNGWVVNKERKVPYVTPDKYPLGDPFPDFNASFINDFRFKNYLSFGFQIDWVKGGNIYNDTRGWLYRDGIHSDFTKPITISGKTGAWASFYNGVYSAVAPNGIKNYFYEDGSFGRLRNAYVGLDFAPLLKSKLKRLQVIISGRNLLTWTKYSGMDPEISTFNTGGVLGQRIDSFVLPNFRTYQITLNIGL